MATLNYNVPLEENGNVNIQSHLIPHSSTYQENAKQFYDLQFQQIFLPQITVFRLFCTSVFHTVYRIAEKNTTLFSLVHLKYILQVELSFHLTWLKEHKLVRSESGTRNRERAQLRGAFPSYWFSKRNQGCQGQCTNSTNYKIRIILEGIMKFK